MSNMRCPFVGGVPIPFLVRITSAVTLLEVGWIRPHGAGVCHRTGENVKVTGTCFPEMKA
jgi:hypothetical protein